MSTPNAPRVRASEAEPRGGGGMDRSRFRRVRRRRVGAVAASDQLLLSANEERTLAKRIKEGDPNARHQLVLANLRLVPVIARRYKNCGLSWDDLVQEGNLGLVRASQDFDPAAYGTRFPAYASFWIRISIHRALAVGGFLVQPSSDVGSLQSRYRRAILELGGDGEALEGGDESAQFQLDQIAEQMGVSLKTIVIARLRGFGRDRTAESEEPAAIEQVAVVDHPPEADFINQENAELVEAALFRLNPFEAWVIRERYGFRELPPEQYGWQSTTRRNPIAAEESEDTPSPTYYHRTLEEIGRACGLQARRVRQVEQTALDKLRRLLVPCC
jgi:RNA polymerase primary sigma factor